LLHPYITMYFLITIPVLALLAWVIFRKRGNTEAIPRLKLDRANQQLLDKHIDFYHKLDRRKRKHFESMVADFLQYVNIEGVGVEITDADKIMVASSAIIPIFGLGNWRYDNLTNVILYPDTFDSEYQFEGGSRNIMGMVGTGYMNGQMLLSRTALVKGFSPAHGSENTAIHEFVHLLDNSDGATDGVPELLLQHEYAAPWLSLMHKEMHRIKEGHSDINPYALTNEAEFFAVASEYFFEKPEQLQNKHPELYQQLSQIFKQN
jgi:Mlc titration factor MtfA (ptsG expression regulator)